VAERHVGPSHKRVEVVPDQRLAEASLVGEVPVKRPLPHPRGSSDLRHARLLDPVLGEELLGDDQKPLAVRQTVTTPTPRGSD
jgi:hypothetical protein